MTNRLLRGVVAAAVLATGITITSLPLPPAEAAIARPLLEMSAITDHGEIVRYGTDGWIDLTGLGIAIDAPYRPFEIRARRPYGEAMTLELVHHHRDGTTTTTPLPAELAGPDFSGLDDFLLLEVRDADDNVVAKRHLGFCPNAYEAQRLHPYGPTETHYPQQCPASIWTKGMVFGIDRGWGVPALGGYQDPAGPTSLDVPDGTYRFRIWIRAAWREALRLPTATSRAAIDVTIRTETFECPPYCDPIDSAPGLRTTFSNRTQDAPRRATPYASVDPNTLPDLRALPAWQMTTANDAGRDYLNFAADVWNAGPAPLVVEGFRRRGEAVMDAHQFFYRDGEPVGSRLVGEMMYHAGGGHDHWHFRDFATYELTAADRTDIQRSGKEAFCLAPTDAIDLTMRKAELRPGTTGLGTACGGLTARWIREVLPAGWGDTYGQYLAGQAFDITDLPNGTYYVKVVANPDQRLIERNLDNNVSYRRVILSGEPGARTVVVPPYRGIDTETGFGIGG